MKKIILAMFTTTMSLSIAWAQHDEAVVQPGPGAPPPSGSEGMPIKPNAPRPPTREKMKRKRPAPEVPTPHAPPIPTPPSPPAPTPKM